MTSSTLARKALFVVAWLAVASFGGAQATPRSTTFALVKTDSAARGGTIQVSSNRAGVEIIGTIDGSTPRWPTSPRDIPVTDRVEVSIADVPAMRLPPIGWGNQFGYEFLAGTEDCAKRSEDTTSVVRQRCVTWFQQQQRYRATIAQLFVRRWAIAPTLVVETLAKPAFASLDDKGRAASALLEPSGTPRARFTAGRGGRGYTFHLTIPWNALPPMQSLRLSELRVLVDVHSASSSPTAGRSSIASAGVSDDPTTFPVVALPTVREYMVTPCRSDFASPVIRNGPSTDVTTASDSAVVYFRPGPTLDLRRAIVLDAPAQGYQYEPDSTAHAPVALTARFWAVALGSGELLCGPRLTYRRGAGTTRSELIIDSTDALSTRRLTDGSVLVKAGPRVVSSAFGSGQCGACPRVRLELFHLDAVSGAVSAAFRYYNVAEPESSDIDIVVSPDWRTITIFELTSSSASGSSRRTWRSVTHCYRPASHTYEVCRNRDGTRPPSPRRVRPVP